MIPMPPTEVHFSKDDLRRRGIKERVKNAPIFDHEFDELLVALDAAMINDMERP